MEAYDRAFGGASWESVVDAKRADGATNLVGLRIRNNRTAPLVINGTGGTTLAPGEEWSSPYRPFTETSSPPLYDDPRVTDKPLATLGMIRRITNDLKAAAIQPDENGMIPIPVHPDSPLAQGDPLAVSLGWRQLATTQGEINRELNAENTRLHDALKVVTDERDAARASVQDEYRNAMSLACEINALRAECARLHGLLAPRPAPVPETPRPAHDWTRVDDGDRRRMGA